MSGRKVELDEAIVPSPELESSLSQKSVPLISTEPRRSTRVHSALEWYGKPVLEVMLLEHD